MLVFFRLIVRHNSWLAFESLSMHLLFNVYCQCCVVCKHSSEYLTKFGLKTQQFTIWSGLKIDTRCMFQYGFEWGYLALGWANVFLDTLIHLVWMLPMSNDSWMCSYIELPLPSSTNFSRVPHSKANIILSSFIYVFPLLEKDILSFTKAPKICASHFLVVLQCPFKAVAVVDHCCLACVASLLKIL